MKRAAVAWLCFTRVAVERFMSSSPGRTILRHACHHCSAELVLTRLSDEARNGYTLRSTATIRDAHARTETTRLE